MIVIDTETSEVREVAERTPGAAATFAAMGLLVRRRMWRDRWLVVSSAVIVALATLLAYAGPELVRGTIDRGASDAVSAAGDAANVLVTYPVGNPTGDNVNSVRGMPVEDFDETAAIVYDNLPPATASIASGYHAWIESGMYTLVGVIPRAELEAAEAEDREPERDGRAGQYITFGYSADAEVALASGALPLPPAPVENSGLPGAEAAEPEPIEISLTTDFAAIYDIEVGDLVVITRSTGGAIELVVSGIVDPVDPTATGWQDLPRATVPTVQTGLFADEIVRGTVMANQETLDAVANRARDAFLGNVEIQVDPAKVTLTNSRKVVKELSSLPQASDQLIPGGSVVPRVQTGLVDALEEYPARARAALAQMSIVIAGVIAVAAVVIALMAQLMLSRREGDLALERARGASVGSIGIRLGLESLLFTVTGMAIGYAGALLLEPGITRGNGLANVIGITALCAAPVLGVVFARRMWAGRREPANRLDRAKVRKAQSARRLTLDALAVVLGIVAVVSVQGRGVLQTQSSGIDPFLAAAPVLIALAVVVVVLRIYPLPMRVVQAIARPTRGVAGVISLAKARQKVQVLPLLALTLAIAVAVSSGLLVSTVRSGQDVASWQRVGAEVRIDAELLEPDAVAFQEQGLTVSRGIYLPVVTFALGSEYLDATLVAMDEDYPLILEGTGVTDTSELTELNELAAQMNPGDPVPVLASQEFMDLDVYGRSELFVGRSYVDVEIVGVATITPDGWAEGPYVIAPLTPLLDAPLEEPLSGNIAFINGEGAADAVAANANISPEDVTTREEWLASVQESALIGGVEFAMVLAVLAVAILAGVGLLVTVLRGVRERGRALSMLRTQGMGAGWGWWLAIAELAPVVLAAVVGGAAAGVLIVYLLGDSLGLEVLSGGLSTPPMDVNWIFMGVVGIGILILLFAAVAVEVTTHRRDRLSDVLRYGETR